MSSDLSLLNQRVNWASGLLDRLEQKLRAIEFDRRNLDFTRFTDENGTQTYSYFVTQIHQPLLDHSFMVGDIVHNLRATLDNLAWLLAGHLPGIDKNQVVFPVCHKDTDLERDRWRWVHLLSAEATEAIRSVQPYRQEDPRNDLLSILSRLWNDDKHRIPHLAQLNMTAVSHSELGPQTKRPKVAWGQPVHPDEIIVSFTVARGDMAPMDVEPFIEVCFQDGILKGTPVLPALKHLRTYVRDTVLPTFRPFLS